MIDESEDDERDIEFSTIQAIFPELLIEPESSHSAHLALQVAPRGRLPVTFELPPVPAPPKSISLSDPIDLISHDLQNGSIVTQESRDRVAETYQLTYLPPLHLHITLPDGYPQKSAPEITLSTKPEWINQKVLESLQHQITSIWDENGRSQVVFAYIDFLQQQGETGFYGVGQSSVLPYELKHPLLEFDRLEQKRRFEQDTFDCGICLEPKKGFNCYRISLCGHVFCVACLQDFYGSAIKEGDIATVKCLDPDCNKKRALHPTELLAIPLKRDQVQRFVDIKRKKKFESDKSTIYCPRKFCQAPARSTKYAKYEAATIETFPDSDSESENGPEPAQEANNPAGGPANFNTATSKPPEDRLAICSKCEYAFCRICQRSWHGDFLNCLPPTALEDQLSAEDKASYNYIRMNTSPCPTCEAPCQKTHGCNHMQCFTCNTHFCYLCSSWLSIANPYQHFNTRGSSCFMRLWELEEGDEGQGRGQVFAGPRAAEQQAAAFAAQFEENDLRINNVEQNVANNNPPLRQRRRNGNPNGNPNGNQNRNVNRAGAADQALQRFLEMAANDEEDGWDSDDMEFAEEWFVR